MVSFPQAIKLFFTRWRDIKGRSTRAEFWWVMLAIMLFNLLAIMISIIPLLSAITLLLGAVVIVFSLVIIVPLFTLHVRRCNDVGLNMFVGIILLFSTSIGLVISEETENFNALILAIGGCIVIFAIMLAPSREID